MQSRHFWNPLQIARCAPDFVTLSSEYLCDGEANARTCTSEKNCFHDFENSFRAHAMRCACCNVNDSYFKYRPDARRPAYLIGMWTLISLALATLAALGIKRLFPLIRKLRTRRRQARFIRETLTAYSASDHRRVIASLSTVPDRINNLRPTIQSLLKQTRP